jgi:hypothetical protein
MHLTDLFEKAAYLQGPEIAPTVSRAHHCVGKTKFASPALAHTVAKRSGRSVYRCPSCGFFHVAGGGTLAIDRKARNASNLVRPEAKSPD